MGRSMRCSTQRRRPVLLMGPLGTSSSTQKYFLVFVRMILLVIISKCLKHWAGQNPFKDKCSLSQMCWSKKSAEFENCRTQLNFIFCLFYFKVWHGHTANTLTGNSIALQHHLKSYNNCSIFTANQKHLVRSERSKSFPGSKRSVFVMISKLDLLLCDGTTVFVYRCR